MRLPVFCFVLCKGCLAFHRPLSPLPLRMTSGTLVEAVEHSPSHDDRWIHELNLDAFGREVAALGRRLEAEQSRNPDEHRAHMNKLRRWSGGCGAVGLATSWLPLNPISPLLLSTWTCKCGPLRRCNDETKLAHPRFSLGDHRPPRLPWRVQPCRVGRAGSLRKVSEQTLCASESSCTGLAGLVRTYC